MVFSARKVVANRGQGILLRLRGNRLRSGSLTSHRSTGIAHIALRNRFASSSFLKEMHHAESLCRHTRDG